MYSPPHSKILNFQYDAAKPSFDYPKPLVESGGIELNLQPKKTQISKRTEEREGKIQTCLKQLLKSPTDLSRNNFYTCENSC